MQYVYVLKNLKNKKICVGMTDDFSNDFHNHKNHVLVSVKTYKDKNEAQKSKKHLESEKGLKELKLKIKKKSLGEMPRQLKSGL